MSDERLARIEAKLDALGELLGAVAESVSDLCEVLEAVLPDEEEPLTSSLDGDLEARERDPLGSLEEP